MTQLNNISSSLSEVVLLPVEAWPVELKDRYGLTKKIVSDVVEMIAKQEYDAAAEVILGTLVCKSRRGVRVKVYQWAPGVHFHALGKGFDTMESAKRYLESLGYSYGGFERYGITLDGD